MAGSAAILLHRDQGTRLATLIPGTCICILIAVRSRTWWLCSLGCLSLSNVCILHLAFPSNQSQLAIFRSLSNFLTVSSLLKCSSMSSSHHCRPCKPVLCRPLYEAGNWGYTDWYVSLLISLIRFLCIKIVSWCSYVNVIEILCNCEILADFSNEH